MSIILEIVISFCLLALIGAVIKYIDAKAEYWKALIRNNDSATAYNKAQTELIEQAKKNQQKLYGNPIKN